MKPTGKALALAGDFYLGRSYSEMDCQAFAERCLRDIGINMNLAGSNAWYRKMTWTGTPEECRKQFGRRKRRKKVTKLGNSRNSRNLYPRG